MKEDFHFYCKYFEKQYEWRFYQKWQPHFTGTENTERIDSIFYVPICVTSNRHSRINRRPPAVLNPEADTNRPTGGDRSARYQKPGSAGPHHKKYKATKNKRFRTKDRGRSDRPLLGASSHITSLIGQGRCEPHAFSLYGVGLLSMA